MRRDKNQKGFMIVERTSRLLVCIVVLSFILFCRLFYLQIMHGDDFRAQAQNNATSQVPLAPPRGLIYDRNGVVIANNVTQASLEITRDQLRDANGNKLKVADVLPELMSVFPAITPEVAKRFVQQESLFRSYQPQPILDRLTQDQIYQFAVVQYQFPGVAINYNNLIRNYPLKNMFANTVGYVGRINAQELAKLDPQNYNGTNYIGQTGIERYYEAQLHGVPGASKVEKNSNGKILKELQSSQATPGSNIYLTIDSKLQAVAQQAMGSDPGAVVALDPNNGQVLVMVSSPNFDPNSLVNSDTVSANFTALLKDPGHPLINRAIQGLYAPGSTAKPFLALEDLDSGIITPDFSINDTGTYQIPGTTHVFHNWNLKSSGKVDLATAIMESNDTFFFTVANLAGPTRMHKILNAFGFGEKPGLDLTHVYSGALPNPIESHGIWHWNKIRWWPGDTEVMGIGQGYTEVTALQLADAVATMGMKGIRYEPTLLLKTQTPDQDAAPNPPVSLPPLILKDPKNWDIVIADMQKVMGPGGTGAVHFGMNTPYSVAGKTGTAQVIREVAGTDDSALPFNERTNSLFIAFAPVDKPKIAIAVITEHMPTAGTVARKVVDCYLLGKCADANTNSTK